MYMETLNTNLQDPKELHCTYSHVKRSIFCFGLIFNSSCTHSQHCEGGEKKEKKSYLQ